MSAIHRSMFVGSMSVTAILLACAMSPAHAAELTPPRDGWTSWQVDAVEGAPDMC